MNEVKFFLKFGKRSRLKNLQDGKLFFSHAKKFRYYEDKLQMKGQGDRLEGGMMIAAKDMAITDNKNYRLELAGNNSVIFRIEAASLLPVFCVFSCFEKDCVVSQSGKLSVKLSDEQKETIYSHFPKADTVAIISNPEQFISDVQSTIGFECKSELVHYFHLNKLDSGMNIANDMEYYQYLMKDIPPKKEGRGKRYSLKAEHAYRSLLCKDEFFRGEQEYRFILPGIKIEEPRLFPVQLQQKIELQDLDAFFASH